MTLKRTTPYLLILCILLLAAGVRFYNLGAQSLWYDEGVAFGHSQRSLSEMIPRLQNNVHVPAYFGSLALYENFVGNTEFGLRSYSVLWSIISVAAVYALGKRLFHPIVGLSAALIVALNSFSIYYAQETRMYAMLAAIACLSIWAFAKWGLLALRVHHTPSDKAHIKQLWQWGLAFAAFNIIGEYTHVSYALVMISHGVLAVLIIGQLLIAAFQKKIAQGIVWQIIGIYVAVNLLSVVLFAPWLLVAISQISSQPNISDTMSLAAIIRIIQGWFAFGRTFEVGMGGMEIVVYFLMLFGLLRLSESDKQQSAWWAILVPVVWVLVSVSLYVYLELYGRYLRFLLPAQLGYALWMGRGVWVLWEIVPRNLDNRTGWQRQATQHLPKVAATVAILAFAWQQWLLLDPLYHDPAYLRDDYRTMVATIETEARPDDAIILSAPGLQEIFGYYYDGEIPVYTLPASPDIAGDTAQIVSDHQRIYVVLYGQAEQDPDGIVTETLNTVGFPIGGEWVGDVRFERFAAPATFTDTEDVAIRFGDSITLDHIAVNRQTFSPNDALQVQLTWSTSAPLATRYKVFLQLLNSEGVLVAQRDSEPAGNQAPTTTWDIDVPVIDNHAIAIPNLESGNYTLILGLYDSDNPQARLAVADGDFYIVDTITIE